MSKLSNPGWAVPGSDGAQRRFGVLGGQVSAPGQGADFMAAGTDVVNKRP
jgi:hypothetical protein